MATRPTTRQRRRVRFQPSRIVLYAILGLVSLLIITPIVYAVLGGFRDNSQLLLAPVGLPNPWLTTNYENVLWSSPLFQDILNSTVIALLATSVVVTFAALAAFVFSRFDFRGREAMYTMFTLGLLFPVAVAIIPIFIMLRTFGLLDSPLGVALPEAAFGLPITIIILRPFFRGVPRELEDAASIDGCSKFGFFWRILLPMARPSLATVAVLAWVGSWNAFLLPLVVLNNDSGYTLPLGLNNFSSQYATDTASVLAFAAMSIVPALIIYAVAERHIVSGLTEGSVKG